MSVYFDQVKDNDGFDRTATPRWQMVPLGQTKTVELINAAGMTLRCEKSGLRMTESGTGSRRRIVLHGFVSGVYLIEVLDGAKVKAQLEVAVKAPKLVKTTFHFVQDSGGKKIHKTDRTRAEIDTMLETANGIITPQANVTFTKHAVHDVTIQRNLGRKVLQGSGKRDEWGYVVFHSDMSADFNVFFVWELEKEGKSGDEGALTETVGARQNCLFEDKVGGDAGHALAHEFGHHLGVKHAEGGGPREWLMYPTSDVRGRHIPKNHANKFNFDQGPGERPWRLIVE